MAAVLSLVHHMPWMKELLKGVWEPDYLIAILQCFYEVAHSERKEVRSLIIEPDKYIALLSIPPKEMSFYCILRSI